MRLTTKSRYAVSALIELSFLESTGPVSLSDIATNQNIELNYLEQLNFPYDVIGLHWYSNMGNLYSYGKEGVNIIDTLSSKFNKKILVDEFNVYQGSLEYIPNSNQQNWLHENLVEILSNSNSLGVIFYELLDQPDFAKNPYSDYYNPGESAYGLYENKTNEKGYILKELYENILLK